MSQCHDTYESDPLATAKAPLLVHDLMTSPPITVGPSTTVKDIAKVLLDRNIRAVPVVDIGDTLVGVVSEADVICRECPTARRHTLGGFVDRVLGHGHDWAEKAEGITAEEIMSEVVISCSPSEPVTVAARRMLSEDVRTMPVVAGSRLVGVISRHDVLRLFDRPDPEIRSRIAKLLRSSVWAPEGHQVSAAVADGIVHLTGSVRFPSDIGLIVSLVGDLPGVIEVRNDVSAEYPEPDPVFLKDTDWR